VRERVIFDENDSSLLQPGATDDGDVLICYTCYPYVTTSIRTQRFAIVCDKISGKDWTKGAAEE
jgi:sortase (surface protein transpeptidase)